MAMKTYDFAYGRGRKTFTVEEDRVLKVVRTEEFPQGTRGRSVPRP